ncbi:hypothetical protein VI26_00380 [Chromobacterium sp. LK1]|nr:hypothetical protein VI26_00380 [Chromobacterium sp. LK1]
MGYQNHFTITMKVITFLVISNDLVNFYNQRLSRLFITLKPIVAMRPDRIVIIIKFKNIFLRKRFRYFIPGSNCFFSQKRIIRLSLDSFRFGVSSCKMTQ